MRLENIGFYTLSDDRARNTSLHSCLQRCELILTNKCNFRCPYCRGLPKDVDRELSYEEAEYTVRLWLNQGLQNVRFSGGEPTVWKGLDRLCLLCKQNNVRHIAISTNGSRDLDYYKHLVDCGVNDFSISLDACCATICNKMSGGRGNFETIVNNIRELSKLTYVTVGMVFTDDNIKDVHSSVMFAHSLGVSDIRVIPSAQYNKALSMLGDLPADVLQAHPILRYRINNIQQGRHVRGISGAHCKCWMMLDDMCVAGDKHFPCIIYMREQGKAIGKVGPTMREDRYNFLCNHDPEKDPICKEMCLDVCVDYNNKVNENHKIVNNKLEIIK